jgi:hypothetical protein
VCVYICIYLFVIYFKETFSHTELRQLTQRHVIQDGNSRYPYITFTKVDQKMN